MSHVKITNLNTRSKAVVFQVTVLMRNDWELIGNTKDIWWRDNLPVAAVATTRADALDVNFFVLSGRPAVCIPVRCLVKQSHLYFWKTNL